jgi:ABC-type proline/glycine betaine transport system permease subunit
VAERPRDRTTILIGALTIVAMAIIATIFLIITSPWNDPHPRFHPKPAHTHAARRG